VINLPSSSLDIQQVATRLTKAEEVTTAVRRGGIPQSLRRASNGKYSMDTLSIVGPPLGLSIAGKIVRYRTHAHIPSTSGMILLAGVVAFSASTTTPRIMSDFAAR
jgi:hypothetical protein